MAGATRSPLAKRTMVSRYDELSGALLSYADALDELAGSTGLPTAFRAIHDRIAELARSAAVDRANDRSCASRMPPELLCHVFRMVADDDLTNVALVRRSWADAIRDDPVLRKRCARRTSRCTCESKFNVTTPIVCVVCNRDTPPAMGITPLVRARRPSAYNLSSLVLCMRYQHAVDATNLHEVLIATASSLTELVLAELELRGTDIHERDVVHADRLTELTVRDVVSYRTSSAGCRRHGCILMCRVRSAPNVRVMVATDDPATVACTFTDGRIDDDTELSMVLDCVEVSSSLSSTRRASAIVRVSTRRYMVDGRTRVPAADVFFACSTEMSRVGGYGRPVAIHVRGGSVVRPGYMRRVLGGTVVSPLDHVEYLDVDTTADPPASVDDDTFAQVFAAELGDDAVGRCLLSLNRMRIGVLPHTFRQAKVVRIVRAVTIELPVSVLTIVVLAQRGLYQDKRAVFAVLKKHVANHVHIESYEPQSS